MTENNHGLPYSDSLDIQTFSRLFDNKTTSYKLIFFYSLLEILRKNFFEPSKSISLQELNVEMLVHSWYPHSVFRLSFGYQDTIANKLDELQVQIDKPLLKIARNDKYTLREIISQKLEDEGSKKTSKKDLRRYVPFRLIRPFFPELKGIKDGKVNQEIASASIRLFDSRRPIYKLSEDLNSIVLHPDWTVYFQENYVIIHGWVVWNLISYMQSKNPNTPGIANKLFPPLDERSSLKEQTIYWKEVLKQCPNIKCIYSDLVITEDNLSLDHYLPWSFVAHNNLWNLIPSPRHVNSSKSNRIPAQTYFEKMIELQYIGARESRKIIKEKKWKNYMECYLVDLKFEDYSEILDFSSFKSKYQSQVMPLIALAESQGFESQWRYQKIP
jgi:hypothetical protein